MHQPAPTPGDTSWFVHDRFGMFIHWGLYALAARHEWVKNREEISNEAYQKYFDHFDPDLFDPRAWARAARAAGMKYFVITSKHHEGFCLWDSQFTDYKATATPCRRDLLREVVEAFRAEGLKVGFYYSLLDWHHPHFPIDAYHPLRNHPDLEQLNRGRDIKIYAQYMRDQVRELLTGFGPISIIWFDFSYPTNAHRGVPGKGHADWESEELLRLARELQPGIIVDNRLDLPEGQTDIHTPEQYQPEEWVQVEGKPVVWEACQTFSGSWGYHREEATWKSPYQLITMLSKTVSRGGNLLMNVGPTGRGTLDNRALQALEVYGEWMQRHDRAIYGCTQSAFTEPPGCRYTQRGNRLYVHIYDWPFVHLSLPGLAGRVEYAQLLNDASEIAFHDGTGEHGSGAPGSLTMMLPVNAPPVTVPVVELFLQS